MIAAPLGVLGSSETWLKSIFSCRNPRRSPLPRGSSPTRPINATFAPKRAAATAWFAPLPPDRTQKRLPWTVCPGVGSVPDLIRYWVLMPPTTTTSHFLFGLTKIPPPSLPLQHTPPFFIFQDLYFDPSRALPLSPAFQFALCPYL